jgi:hypothetical protein
MRLPLPVGWCWGRLFEGSRAGLLISCWCGSIVGKGKGGASNKFEGSSAWQTERPPTLTQPLSSPAQSDDSVLILLDRCGRGGNLHGAKVNPQALSGMNSVEGCCWRYTEGEQDDVTLQPNQHGQTAGTSTLTRFPGASRKDLYTDARSSLFLPLIGRRKILYVVLNYVGYY